MLELSKRLLYYKRKDVQEAIVQSSKNREVGIRFGEKGFGKRPDVLVYANDVLESVKQGATSFHLSEELWSNPLLLTTELKKQDLNDLRVGWDLLLDIDCPNWFFSKLTTHLFVKALKEHEVKSISCKFSGNKGFHIGVPFKAFSKESIFNNIPLKNWFPDGPKRIAGYLLEFISTRYIRQESEKIIFDNSYEYELFELAKEFGVDSDSLVYKSRCRKCKKPQERKQKIEYEYICPRCEHRYIDTEKSVHICERCKAIMNYFSHKKTACSNCGAVDFEEIFMFNPLSIVEIDTLLISSRHMFRAPYSLHEKSGLVSIPINPEEIMNFEKETAQPEKVGISKYKFLDDSESKEDETLKLMTEAFDYGKQSSAKNTQKSTKGAVYESIGQAIPQELFPPCMVKIMQGLTDGRKRALFVLTNFLTSVGWGYNEAETILLEWNKKNKEPLREGNIKSQVRYHKQRNKKVLPPNCRSYYQDFSVCFPDNLCAKIKNPVQYAKRKSFILNKPAKNRTKLSLEQKEMRKKFRENLKKGVTSNIRDEDKT